MTKPLACLIWGIFWVSFSRSQGLQNMNPPATNGQSKDFIPASPTAAGLGSFGQVPVGNYTGTAEINVPFYTVNYRDLSIPIGISYHADGNKPDLYPGLTGQGWVLNAGGAITRVVRGLPDDGLYTSNGFIPVLYNPTAETDWNTTTKLNSYLTSGGFFTDQDRTNPDEFYFNFNGVSGKFYMVFPGTFKVKSSMNTYYSVTVQTAANKSFTMPLLDQDNSRTILYTQPYNNVLGQLNMIYKITITDDHGIQYIFGGTDNSIEFSRPGHDYSSPDNATINRLVTPMTWQLTSIVSPNGYAITFDYERGYQVTKVGYCDVTAITWTKQGGGTTHASSPPVTLGQKSTLINTSTLTKITTPKETLTFTTSPAANQLPLPHDPEIYTADPAGTNHQNMFSWYLDIGLNFTENMMVGKKLDAIVINDANNVLYKTIRFNYTNSTSTRLKLLSVAVSGNNNNTGLSYSFEYNPLSLPPYLSYQTDHYGYFNGHNTYITTTDAGYYLSTLDQALFYQSKAPDPNYVQAEMLTKITYPTGGFTEFVYEPNQYATQVQTWPFTTVTTANTITGGVRIKQVNSYSAAGQKAFSKQYYYTGNYLFGGTSSSGVLAYQPVYYEHYTGTVVPPAKYVSSPQYYNGTLAYWQWSSNPIFPLSETRGHHITYSEVTEVSDDGGAIVYKYKNYDNGYNDVQPLNQVSDNTGLKEFWKEDEGISMDLERGQPLSEEYYDAAKVLKLKKVYEYNSDPARFNNNVRILSQTPNSPSKGDLQSLRIVASLVYTYFPYLSKVTQTEYPGGGQPNLETAITYEYDNNYRALKKTQTTSSDGRTLTTLNNYPQDIVATGNTDPYQNMVTAGMVGVLLSSESQSNGTTVKKNTTGFSKNLAINASLLLPQQVKTQLGSQSEEVLLNFNQYDNKGNPVSQSAQEGIKICYIWSYNYTYPVAKIVNADYSTVLSVLGGQQAVDGFSAGFPSDNSVNSFLQALRTDTRLSAAMVYTYTYNPLLGMTTQTDQNQRTSYYEYDFMGRLSIIRDQDHNIIKKICYNYAGLPGNCGGQ